MSDGKGQPKTVGDTEWYQNFERNMDLVEKGPQGAPTNIDLSLTLPAFIERLEKIERQQEEILDILRRLLGITCGSRVIGTHLKARRRSGFHPSRRVLASLTSDAQDARSVILRCARL
ncbi:MAG: hypothetical protein ISN28_16155 [Ectothiorhodospiraceae bacterium AqS1]|nr:hypothetical protein [Ectothiorhodospiraceae bacterium AqS1]